MKEKIITWFAYFWAGFTGFFSSLSFNEVGVLVSIVATLITMFVNWYYKRHTLQVLENHPDSRKAYEQMED
ncbi:phage holin [Photobacterium ganghwense]|uniref:phage holin n=1 Tax=Photobacterium ganghwense TaxID=320778 RepID=UPI0040560C94